jgi:hypothetical protein
MKKIYALILAAVIVLAIPTVAFATSGKLDIDLSKLSYDELVELKDQINLAIWNSEEWQEVEVPHGVWQVGKDIPAGKWTISAGDKCNVKLEIGNNLDITGTSIEWDTSWTFWRIRSKNYRHYDPASDIEYVTIDLQDGVYVTIDEGYVIFSPYSGKPTLGFKNS